MRKLYVIRESTTGAWCSASKHSSFHMNFKEAAIFNQRKNADKAIKEMIRDMRYHPRYRIYTDTSATLYALHNPGEGEVQSPGFGLEVVECKLIPDFRNDLSKVP